MKRTIRTFAAIGLAVPFFVGSSSAADSPGAVERGRYLVLAMDCGACHTPWKIGPGGPAPDADRLLSGHPDDAALPPPPSLPPGPWNVVTAGNTAWSGPWGISYASNLTPEPDTGIGAWTAAQFAATMRTGSHLGNGREVLPPMPRYPHLTDADLEAMFAYLMSIPPVRNRPPEPQPPGAAPKP